MDETADLLANFSITPLPLYNWQSRPVDVPLTRKEVIAALCETRGNIGRACEMLLVPRSRLSTFLKNDPAAAAMLEEIRETIVDRAEGVVSDILDSKDEKLKLDAAKIVLFGSQKGRERGWGDKAAGVVGFDITKNGVKVRWANEQESSKIFDPSKDATIIDADPIEGEVAA